LASKEAELGYTFTFPEGDVGFWRPLLPVGEDSNEGRYFESVGIGCKWYYSISI
jgi:hypothetical protein